VNKFSVICTFCILATRPTWAEDVGLAPSLADIQNANSCELGTGVVEVSSLRELPANILMQLNPTNLADKRMAFQSADVIMPGTTPTANRRLFRAGHLGPIWFTWIEDSGIGLYLEVATYDSTGTELDHYSGWCDPCERTRALLLVHQTRRVPQ
jgi:hypothetical protein